MARSYFLRIVALVPFILSGVSILSKANECHSIPDLSTLYNTQHGNWMFANNSYFNNQEPYASRIGSPFFYRQSYKWRSMLPRGKKGSKKETNIVHYQSEDSIVFDAKRNILELHGASSIAYDKMKLEADVVALHVNAHTIHAQGTKDLHNKPVGNPVFIYEDVTKNKYGKDDSTKTRTFFTEAIWYNIETKRGLVRNLLTKQEEAIVRSKQVKKEDEEIFYGQDIVFTTCALEDPHFSIRTKRAKLVQDQQITTGPFRFYFDKVPTPLGCFFGTLFLEGKRTHGIIPPEIGEGDDGFYLRNGGYYINFKDYVDISMLGSLYSSGTRAFKNELRYKKRYLCSGNLYYAGNIMEKETGWSLQWEHKTLTHGSKSFNANVRLHNKAYKTSDREEKTRGHKKLPKSMEQQSSGSLSYDDQLVGLPYRLTLRAEYNNNLISNFKHWTLPIGTLSSTTWHPFRIIGSKGANHWFHNIQISHSIHFENHFQNAKDEPKLSSTEPACSVPKSASWNTYTENGLKHVIPLSVQWKVFEAINLKPHFNYQEGWYWLKKGTKGPIRREGFNRVYAWDFGAGLDTTLYHTHYFKDPRWIEGFRVKTAPSCSFTYTPDFSKQYFIEIEKEPGEGVKAYAFKGLRPGLDLANRATSVVQFQLQNTVELKVKKAIEPEKKEKDRQRTTRKIFLLKNLDLETQYDFKATECHLTKGISLHIASEAKIGKIGKASFDLNVNFDPYLSKTVESASNAELLKIERINAFAWNHGKYLGKVNKARFKIHMDFTHYASSQTKQKKNLLNDDDHLSNKLEENKIDFETPWNCGLEFNWIYTRLYEYKRGEKKYNTEKYIAFNGDITLVKKWKVGLRSTYNFTKSEFDPYATEISIQRDLHCWQLSYEWHPLGESAKYDFSLGVKANVLKALKLPRKRSYNKLK